MSVVNLSTAAFSSPFSDASQEARVLVEIAAAAASGATELDLSRRGLTRLPDAIGSLTRLEKLNLADNALSDLPDALANCASLRILFFLGNRFTEIPEVIGRLPALEMLSFKSNVLERISETALPATLHWLILTDNRLKTLPAALGRLHKLRKLMLSANALEELPDVSGLKSLELVRLSDNRLRAVPPALLALPRLAWLALAGNQLAPMKRDDVTLALKARSDVRLPFEILTLGRKLGEGASGTVFASTFIAGEERGGATCSGNENRVAVKIFKAASSDGRPVDEVAALMSAPQHPALVNAVGFVLEDSGGTTAASPPSRLVSVLELCDGLSVLGKPPSFRSVTRDEFARDPAPAITFPLAAAAARAVAGALAALHATGIAHGDVYAHNFMVDDAIVVGDVHKLPAPATISAKLVDLGAAFFYDRSDAQSAAAFERIEMRGFACFVQDLVSLAVATREAGVLNDVSAEAHASEALLRKIAAQCGAEGNDPQTRPLFSEVEAELRLV